MDAVEDTILMNDGRGVFVVIDFKSPDQTNEGLGYWICPDGNQRHAHAAMLEEMKAVAKSVTSAHLTKREARQVLRQRLLPKLNYKLQVTSFSRKQCQQMNS